MNKNVLTTLIAAAAFSSSAAFAGNFYVGLGFGQTDAGDIADELIAGQRKFASYPTITIESVEDDDTAFKIMAGFALNQNFAVELSYADLGETVTEVTSTDVVDTDSQKDMIEVTAISLDMIGTLPITNKFSAFAKAGLTRTSLDYSYEYTDTFGAYKESGGSSDDKIGLHYGAGLGVQVIPALNVFAEYEVYQVKAGDDYKEDLASINVGARYAF